MQLHAGVKDELPDRKKRNSSMGVLAQLCFRSSAKGKFPPFWVTCRIPPALCHRCSFPHPHLCHAVVPLQKSLWDCKVQWESPNSPGFAFGGSLLLFLQRPYPWLCHCGMAMRESSVPWWWSYLFRVMLESIPKSFCSSSSVSLRRMSPSTC